MLTDTSVAPDRMASLVRAALRINEKLDYDAVLQEVVDSACALTDARYGVLLTHTKSGAPRDVVTSGMTAEQLERMHTVPQGKGLLGYMNELQGPLRVSDITCHPKSVGLPPDHPPMKNFLGNPIYHGDKRVGNIYLTEKKTAPEFTSQDQEAIELLSAYAASAISNALLYEKERSAKADLESLVNISPVGVVVFDARSANIVSFNPEARRMLDGLRFADKSWENIFRLLSFRRADGRELSFAELPLTRVLQSGETVRAEEIIICMPDGRSVTTLVNAKPIYSESGEIRSVVTTIQDMTPWEDEELMRGEFLELVSQELRMPLSAIKGSIASLMDEMAQSDQTESLQLLRIIDQQSDQMRSQINSLIELTHIQAGTLAISPRPTILADMVSEACREFQRGHVKGTVDVDIASDLPLVMADRQRIVQVVQNLLKQASQRSAEGPGLKITASVEDFIVAVSVAENKQCGVTPAALKPAPWVQKFQTKEEKRPTNSDGLAFAIGKGIVEAHGGRMWADENADGERLRFTFTIPTADETNDGYWKGQRGSEIDSPGPGQKPKILLAIDDPRTLGAVRRVLSRADYAPIASFDFGDLEGLAGSERPELLVMDLTEAKPAHFELLRRLYSMYELPIIVLSERGDDDSIVKAFEIGADGYIVKPFSPTELTARIKASLRKHSASRRAKGQAVFKLHDVVVDYASHVVTVAGRPTQLTATEYKLLCELSSCAGRVLTQDDLLRRVWGPEYAGEAQLLRAYVKTLRQKLGDNARDPSYIFTEHGTGYRMAKP
ncbi:MAG: winged helix-turn-helix domain-containing protein [Dehalococcoidia bacterium]|nr:winged helix-turn-helix domain-containing protein [Dehalococcoidia bacterium]